MVGSSSRSSTCNDSGQSSGDGIASGASSGSTSSRVPFTDFQNGVKTRVRISLAGLHLPGFPQQTPVKRLDPATGLLQRLFDLAVPLDDGRLVAAVPDDQVGSGRFDQFGEDATGVPGADHQASPSLFKRIGQIRQRMVQPPAAGSAGRPVPFSVRIPDKNGECRVRIGHGVAESRIVCET